MADDEEHVTHVPPPASSSASTGAVSAAPIEIVAPNLPQAERADKFLLTRLPKLSRSALQRLFEHGNILINGQPCKKNHKVKTGDVFKILLISEAPTKTLEPVARELTIIFEDEHLVVINKEPGMAVHPGEGEESSDKVTLVHVLLHRYGREGLSEGEEGGERPGIVHRLDKDTSGLMMVCKNNEAHVKMKAQFQAKASSTTLKKTYYALVLGKVAEKNGTIDSPIMRSKVGSKMMIAPVGEPKGKPAVTHYKVLKGWHLQKQSYTLLEVQIETGRTHQIRVHLSSHNHPIVGDVLYSTKHHNHHVPYLLLTAKELTFEHPSSREKLSFSIDLPAHFNEFMKNLDQQQQAFDKLHAQQKKGKKSHNPYETNLEDLEI